MQDQKQPDQVHYDEDDPRHHTARLKTMLNEVVDHAREDVGKIEEPKAQALFETMAEVCASLVRAVEHYENQSEPAWQR